MAKDYDLDEVKLQYGGLKERYNLPNFELLNQEFSIEKIADSRTENLTKEIRRFIADKVFNYLRFIETLLNPANAPMFIFSVIKSMAPEDKKKLTDIYGRLSEIDLELIKLDVESSETKDAEFIRRVYDSWQAIKRELIPVLGKLKISKENGEEKSDSRYFG